MKAELTLERPQTGAVNCLSESWSKVSQWVKHSKLAGIYPS